jgi:hypothetical protein
MVPRGGGATAYDDDDSYLSEDEAMGSQSSSSSTSSYSSVTAEDDDAGSPHHQQYSKKGARRRTFLPKVLGFSADDVGTEDWKELRAGMMAKERAMPFKADFNAEYTKRRSVLVEWMSQTSETVLRLVPITVHIAVAYLDAAVAKLGDQHIKPTRLQLIATACILAAGIHSPPPPRPTHPTDSSVSLVFVCVKGFANR